MTYGQALWTMEEEEIVRTRWAIDGVSAQTISDELPGRSRNSIIGKVNRLGLQRHGYAPPVRIGPPPRPNRPKPPPITTRAPQALRVAQDRQERLPAIIQPAQPMTAAHGPVPFVEATGCRWPLWNGEAEPSQKFVCGARRKIGDPYCNEHMRVAYQPVRPERKAKPPGRIMWAAE